MSDPLGKFVDEVLQDNPVLNAIRDRLASGEITEEQALGLAQKAVRDNPMFMNSLQQAAHNLAVKEDAVELPPDGPLGLFKPSSKGLPRLNPLVEAALGERLQFDGDIPELRTGPLPPGVAPAVSVKTTVRDPAALGRMLDKASERVAKEVEAADKKLKAIANDGLDLLTTHTDIIKKADEGGDLVLHGSAETDAPSYKRGQVPAPVRTRRPSGSALATMSSQERKEKAFKFFSTTQGRRSAVPIIQELVATSLRSEGWTVKEREYDPRVHRGIPDAFHEWSVGLSGANSTQAAFSVIDVAARAIAKNLVKQLQENEVRKGAKVTLEVVPVNAVDLRTVGWAARVFVDVAPQLH